MSRYLLHAQRRVALHGAAVAHVDLGTDAVGAVSLESGDRDGEGVTSHGVVTSTRQHVHAHQRRVALLQRLAGVTFVAVQAADHLLSRREVVCGVSGFGVLVLHGWQPGHLQLLVVHVVVECGQQVATHALLVLHHKAILGTVRQECANQLVSDEVLVEWEYFCSVCAIITCASTHLIYSGLVSGHIGSDGVGVGGGHGGHAGHGQVCHHVYWHKALAI